MIEIKDLSIRLKRNEPGVLMELYNRQFDYLAAFPFCLLPTIQDCEDVLSESLCSIWERRQNFDSDGQVIEGLKVIIKNKTYDILRKLRNGPTYGDEEFWGALEAVPNDDHSSRYGVEKVRLIYTAIGKLPPVYRQMMELIYNDKLSITEAAAALGIPRTTAGDRKARAVELIIKMIRKHDKGLRNTGLTLLFITVLLILRKFL